MCANRNSPSVQSLAPSYFTFKEGGMQIDLLLEGGKKKSTWLESQFPERCMTSQTHINKQLRGRKK